MFGVDPDIASSALRLWVAAGAAALLVFACALAFDWARTRTAARVGVVVVGAVLGATLAWAFLDAASVRDGGVERRALEARAAQLDAESLAPGSALACLNGLAGDEVETACEKALFGGPAAVASATSYVAARFALLADIVAYTRHGGGNIDSVLLPLRRSLEADRFGFVAHALAAAGRCTGEHCQALALLDNPSRIRANLSGQTFERYLDRYLTVWAQSPEAPLAETTAPPATTGQPGAGGQRKVMVDIDFPSAASIPPVSIMNPEPKGPPVAAANEAGAASSRQSRRPAGTQSVPAAASSVAPVDPVWLPGTATSAPAPPAAASAAPAGVGPMQINPFAAPPLASGSGSTGAQ